MAATMEMLNEYKTYNSQFCKRLFDFLSISFVAQVNTSVRSCFCLLTMTIFQSRMLLGDNDGVAKPDGKARPSIVDHEAMEIYLGRYSGLLLYLREMDESLYAKLCAVSEADTLSHRHLNISHQAYFSAVSNLHRQQVKALLVAYSNTVKKAPEDDLELGSSSQFGVRIILTLYDAGFNTTPTSATFKTAGGMRRTGTLVKSLNDTRDSPKERGADRARASEVRQHVVLSSGVSSLMPNIPRFLDSYSSRFPHRYIVKTSSSAGCSE